MPEDSRQKYQLNLTLRNGQAYQVVTHMPVEAVRAEIKAGAIRKEDDQMARCVFDGINPLTDDRVSVEIDPTEIIGFYHHKWSMPVQRGVPAPQIVQ
jgi:hypothetical protein